MINIEPEILRQDLVQLWIDVSRVERHLMRCCLTGITLDEYKLIHAKFTEAHCKSLALCNALRGEEKPKSGG